MNQLRRTAGARQESSIGVAGASADAGQKQATARSDGGMQHTHRMGLAMVAKQQTLKQTTRLRRLLATRQQQKYVHHYYRL